MPHARQIDLSALPEDVVALVETLGPGDEVVIARDGVPVATLTGAGGALEGTVEVPVRPEADVPSSPARAGVTVVATAMKLPAAARAQLSEQLGADYIVVDLHAAPATADVVLVPPASPQLIGHLRQMFPEARIMAAEFEDEQLGVSYRGPLGRLADAGVETYLTSSTMASLARHLDRAVTHRPAITAPAAGGRRQIGSSTES